MTTKATTKVKKVGETLTIVQVREIMADALVAFLEGVALNPGERDRMNERVALLRDVPREVEGEDAGDGADE